MTTACGSAPVSAYRAFLAMSFFAVLGCAATDMASTVASAEPPLQQRILLTGFEPFGEQRPPNPSWQGIRDLSQTKLSGFDLQAVELPVVWGEPMKRLEHQIQTMHPTAIFSFGQGGPGSFAIETRAVNIRGKIPDNLGNLPSEQKIVSSGADVMESAFPAERVAAVLRDKGYPVRISRQAGQYLCEETLYSLEFLRTSHPELTVSFCHVPPLGSTVETPDQRSVDAQYVQAFVQDYIRAWQTVSAESPAIQNQIIEKSAHSNESSRNPELTAVESLIQGYFLSWSEQRMKDYGNCFADDAVVQEINNGRIHTESKGPFVANQTTYHKMALFKAVEIPVRTNISFAGELAHAVVYWKLTAGPRIQFGYDHFTLVKQRGTWKIANLVFYGTHEEK